MNPTSTVVKVGGSLFDLPDLRDRLQGWMANLDADGIVLVPGGGAMANTVRMLDRVHHLGAEVSHWLAIQAMSLNARFLQTIFPDAAMVTELSPLVPGLSILDPLPFFRDDEARVDHLPHIWEVTSDSLAVRAAIVVGACEVVLLKSVAWRGSNWTGAQQAGIVDAFFSAALRGAPSGMCVRIVNLRSV